jgi:stearoyl-CoA desaturase (delta-9 desaturase)
VHSPRHKGFFYSHVGWIFYRQHDLTDLVKVADFAAFPELRWLHRFEQLPSVILAVLCYLIAGWSASWSALSGARCCCFTPPSASIRWPMFTAASATSPVMIPATTGCLAFFTMGEGWHNNHHAYQSSVRQGFRWWEIDATFIF